MTTPDRDPYRPDVPPGFPPPPADGAFPPPPDVPPTGHPVHGHPLDGPAAGGHPAGDGTAGHDGGYGYGYPPGAGQPGGFGTGPGYGADPGYGTGSGYDAGPGYGAGPGYPVTPGYAAGGYDGGYDAAAGYGAGHGTHSGLPDGGAYVPEPLGGQLPAEADPGAAFGVPSAGDAWGGHASAQDAYQGPAGVDGWGQAPPAAQPWEHAAAVDGTGYAPAQPGTAQPGIAQPGPAQWSQPHGYAAQQPFAGTEHTAVLPLVEEAPPRNADGPSAAGAPAPVRTGSPIIPPGIQPAALTAALGLLTAGAAALGKPGLAVVLLVLEAVTAAGWFRLNGMWPARQGIVLAFMAGVTADVALLIDGGHHNAEVLVGTLGVWLVLVLVLQLRHHGSADERLSSLTATSASTLLTVVAAGYLATAESGAGSDPVVVGAIAVAAATLVRAVRLPGGEPVSVVLSVLAALVTGLATGPATGMGGGHGVLLAAACGIGALIGLRVASYDFPSRFVHFTAGVALPLTAAAPVAYLLGNALH
ncbi:hypothetical protein [Streptomyces sp. NPDC020917]|uniref:hypothetical protein n=1 Tax=Streptomyces sp. NPDC020917 TaxID=3365102 RepID=UPI0037A95153